MKKMFLGVMTAAVLLTGCGRTDADPITNSTPQVAANPIDHYVILFMENHSFDSLWGGFPGANGLNSPNATVPQVDLQGDPLPSLPAVPQTRIPQLPNSPFLIDQFYAINEIYPSPEHRFYKNLLQLNGEPVGDGRFGNFQNNQWVSQSTTTALAMGHFDTTKLPLLPYAQQYTLMDNFFTSTMGGSMLGHFWLIGARTPTWQNPDPSLVLEPQFDDKGKLIGLDNPTGLVTPDGFVVENTQPFYPPFEAGKPDSERMPPQDYPTIGDRLSEAGVSWAWFAEGWNEADAGNPSDSFKYHHQPFVYFEGYRPGTTNRGEHLKDLTDYERALADGTLPTVSFVKFTAANDEHPATSSVENGEQSAVDLIEKTRASSAWPRTAIIVTYDDFGGFYDHVPPVMQDRFGPGNRIPCLLISPYARQGFVDHTLYSTESILKLLEDRYGLQPLTDRDANANSLAPAFDFTQEPNL
jgi:acid phosphatase